LFKNKYLRFILGLLLGVAATLPAGAAQFSFAAMGDTPYVLPQDFERFERLIQRINAARPSISR
jgi:molybdopterin-guanine dinucleotide biosynthesis protein A